MDNDIIKSTSDTSTVVKLFTQRYNDAAAIAEFIATTSIYSKNFLTRIPDPKNPDTTIEAVNKADIIAAILIATELGIDNMGAILMGNILDSNSYYKVMRGRTMGMDPFSAINNIHVFKTSSGQSLVYMGVHSISKVLTESNVHIEYIKDCEEEYYYRDSTTNVYVGTKLDDTMFLMHSNSSEELLTTALKANKQIVYRCIDTVCDAIGRRFDKLTPDGKPMEHRIKYSLLDATVQGLYKGIDKEGNEVKGKDNWNSNPKGQLQNRITILIGRKIAGDKLYGVYNPEEIKSANDDESIIDTDVEDVTNK